MPWVNGIPRQKALYDDDSIAVPLTVPAPFTGYAFDTEHLARTASKVSGGNKSQAKEREKEAAVKFAPVPPHSPNKASYPPVARTASRASGKGDWAGPKGRPRGASFVNVPASGPTTSNVPGADTAYPNAAASGINNDANTMTGPSPSVDVASPFPLSASVDPEKTASPSGWSTTAPAFRSQAITSATSYLRSGAESRSHAFARLDKHHRVQRRSEDVRSGKAHITSVELMPPRHPPTAQWWDFFPPARLVKITVDWVRKREKVLQQERVRGGRRKRGGGVRSEIPQEMLYVALQISPFLHCAFARTIPVDPRCRGTDAATGADKQDVPHSIRQHAHPDRPAQYDHRLARHDVPLRAAKMHDRPRQDRHDAHPLGVLVPPAPDRLGVPPVPAIPNLPAARVEHNPRGGDCRNHVSGLLGDWVSD